MSQLIELKNVVANPAHNVARARAHGGSYLTSTGIALASAMLQAGWLDTSIVGLRPMQDTDREECTTYIESEIKRLEQQASLPLKEQVLCKLTEVESEEDKKHDVKVSVTASLLLAEYKRLYCNKKGDVDLSKVKYCVVFGHHRTNMAIITNAVLHNVVDVKPIRMVCNIHDYASAEQAQDACISENGNDQLARTKINTYDVLAQASIYSKRAMTDPSWKEARHTRLTKQRGLCQQAWAFIKLGNNFPELDLYNKAISKARVDANDPDSKLLVPYTSLKAARIRALNGDTKESTELAELAEVEAYTSDPLGDNIKDISLSELGSTLKDNTPNRLVKHLMAGVKSNNREVFTQVADQYTVYNAVFNAVGQAKCDTTSAAIAVLNEAIATLEADLATVASIS